jgi:hypothetical protein
MKTVRPWGPVPPGGAAGVAFPWLAEKVVSAAAPEGDCYAVPGYPYAEKLWRSPQPELPARALFGEGGRGEPKADDRTEGGTLDD